MSLDAWIVAKELELRRKASQRIGSERTKLAAEADMFRAVRHELLKAKQARQDAERYKLLRDDFSVMSPDIDGKHSWVYRRNFSLRGPTLDAAIDAELALRAIAEFGQMQVEAPSYGGTA